MPDERAWVEPRLAALLGLAETPEGSREELFAAWRTLFQRIAERGTTVMVFEDLQWADRALLDFIDDLLEWSRSSPILVITLARPELLERRPDWGAGRRSVSTTLEPLDRALMAQLLAGLVPGLPALGRRGHRRSGGGRPALRGRARPDAHRGRPARGHRRRLPPRRRPDEPGRPGDAPGAGHGTARCARRRRPLAPPGGRRARHHLHPGSARGDDRPARVDRSSPASDRSSGASCSRSTRIRAHPPAASTGSSRRSPTMSPTTAWGDASGGHSTSPPHARSRRRATRSSPASSPRISSPRTAPCRRVPRARRS